MHEFLQKPVVLEKFQKLPLSLAVIELTNLFTYPGERLEPGKAL